MPLDQLTADEKARITDLFDSSISVMRDIDDLKEGMRETIKSVAEELDIKPSVLSKAIKVAYKANLQDEKDSVDTIEQLLEASGRG